MSRHSEIDENNGTIEFIVENDDSNQEFHVIEELVTEDADENLFYTYEEENSEDQNDSNRPLSEVIEYVGEEQNFEPDDEDSSNMQQPNASEDVKHKMTMETYKGPRRYVVFDDLIANIVNFEDGTPIVEFKIANKAETSKLPVECGICPEVMTRFKLDTHLGKHYNSEKNQYQCEYCNESYRDYKYLAGHARRHMGIRPYVCNRCELFFSTKQDLRVHTQRRHSEKKFVCHICGKQFSQNTQLKKHAESTHEKKRRYKCDKCPKAYYKNFSLKEHVRNIHLGERRMLKCPFCGMECRDAHKMARHRKLMHLQQKTFNCVVCREEFNNIHYFDAHKRSIQCRNNTKRMLSQNVKLEQSTSEHEESDFLVIQDDDELIEQNDYDEKLQDEEEYYVEEKEEIEENEEPAMADSNDCLEVSDENTGAFIEQIDGEPIEVDINNDIMYEIIMN